MTAADGSGWRRAGRGAAGLGGASALAATVLLPFHLGGGLGTAIAAGFLAAGLLLGVASVELAARFPRDGRGRWLRNWAVLGAAGFAVSGAGLVADVVESPMVTAELVAVVAVAAWWVAAGRALASARPWFAGFSYLAALSAVAALAGQVVWEPAAGAVPARFAYALWGPWGLWLAVVMGRLGRR